MNLIILPCFIGCSLEQMGAIIPFINQIGITDIYLFNMSLSDYQVYCFAEQHKINIHIILHDKTPYFYPSSKICDFIEKKNIVEDATILMFTDKDNVSKVLLKQMAKKKFHLMIMDKQGRVIAQ